MSSGREDLQRPTIDRASSSSSNVDKIRMVGSYTMPTSHFEIHNQLEKTISNDSADHTNQARSPSAGRYESHPAVTRTQSGRVIPSQGNRSSRSGSESGVVPAPNKHDGSVHVVTGSSANAQSSKGKQPGATLDQDHLRNQRLLQDIEEDEMRADRSSYGRAKLDDAVPSDLDSTEASDAEDDEAESEENKRKKSSLTRQLAETAVGVREMSKQLGRARVQSLIQSVMIITKAKDNHLIKLTREMAIWLMSRRQENGRGLIVYVDAQLRRSKRFDAAAILKDHPEFAEANDGGNDYFSSQQARRYSLGYTNGDPTGKAYSEMGQLRYWTSEMCAKSAHLFDFVVTLGGDGTVLFASWLFQRTVPPVLSFALGSLGFLTNFDYSSYTDTLRGAIENGIRVNLRMRFTCTVYRSTHSHGSKDSEYQRRAFKSGETGEIVMKNREEDDGDSLECGGQKSLQFHASGKDREVMCFSTRPMETFEVLNDLVVDRGPSPFVSMLELFGDDHHMTTVQADGLCIATPTGSTAYSLSAGGSLVHPEIPAILITPLCPHTLSFRPMLLPDSMELRICVPYNSRSGAWASFDGRGRVELKLGDHIKVTASRYPFPTVCHDMQSTDWFNAIGRTLHWNERQRQKSFVVVEEARPKPRTKDEEVRDRLVAEQQQEVASKPESSPQDSQDGQDDDDGSFDIGDSAENENEGIGAVTSSSSPLNTMRPNSPGRWGAKIPHLTPLHPNKAVQSAPGESDLGTDQETDAGLSSQSNEPTRYRLRRAAGEVGERDHLREKVARDGGTRRGGGGGKEADSPNVGRRVPHHHHGHGQSPSSSTSSSRRGGVTWSDRNPEQFQAQAIGPGSLAAQLERIHQPPSLEGRHPREDDRQSVDLGKERKGHGRKKSAGTRRSHDHTQRNSPPSSSRADSPTETKDSGPVAFAVFGQDSSDDESSESTH